jgi:VWFA-related protein
MPEMKMPSTGRRSFLKALAGVAMAQVGRSAPESEPFKLSVDVDQVMLHISVQDRQGGFVSGLKENDFSVFEDGRPQKIRFFLREDVPVTVGMVVDNSSSMHPKRKEVIAAALSFADSSNREDEMFLVDFNERVWLGLPDELQFTSTRDELKRALERMEPGGKTALYDAILLGLNHLAAGSKDKKVLIVVSDGGDNASEHKLDEVLHLAGRSNAIVYTIGLFDEDDHDRNPKVLRRIAAETGGEVFLPEETEKVVDACNHIAREIRNQYTIGYSSDNAVHDGRYRRIKVVLGPDKYRHAHVRARAGYIAPGA